MKYGMPTLIELRTVEEHAKICAETGLDFYELNLAFPWFQSDKLDIRELQRIREKYGIEYTIHLHDEVNPLAFAPEMRSGAIRNVSYALELARAIGAKRLNMHLQNGMYSAVGGVKIYACGLCEDEYLLYVKQFVSFVEEKMKDMPDAVFCIENTSGYKSYHKKAIELMLKSPVFGLTFDIGHNYKASEDDESFILSHADRLRHFHIHDVTKTSNHVSLGEGLLDVDRYLDMAESYGCPVVIEVKEKNDLLKSIEYVRRRSL
ncbi:MAG: sugar phosphate isomerase/epimerase [Spirochaetales bacterium]|nr:sugar phosphate isomerase/epimerase [Spirochaetales bacterium]